MVDGWFDEKEIINTLKISFLSYSLAVKVNRDDLVSILLQNGANSSLGLS